MQMRDHLWCWHNVLAAAQAAQVSSERATRDNHLMRSVVSQIHGSIQYVQPFGRARYVTAGAGCWVGAVLLRQMLHPFIAMFLENPGNHHIFFHTTLGMFRWGSMKPRSVLCLRLPCMFTILSVVVGSLATGQDVFCYFGIHLGVTFLLPVCQRQSRCSLARDTDQTTRIA
jgi:hypothetical protein